jgi:acyl CoA:acetate/3-ketoacid CoA transferase alpha subunit
MTIDDAIEQYIKDGMDIAIGGSLTYNMPSAIAREIINKNIKNLTIYSFIATYPVDLLIGAKCVDRIMSPFVTFGELGLAPSFRRAVENEEVEVIEVDEAFWGFSLKAGAASLPFIPLAEGYDTDIPSVNPMYKKVVSPYDNKEYITVPPLKPSLAIIHVQYADEYGNGIHLGNKATDLLLAKASKKVILTCDKILSNEEIIRRNKEVTIPSFLVDAVINIDFCCHPLGSDMLYKRDEEHLRYYVKAGKTEEGFNEYLSKYVTGKSHSEYLASIGKDKLSELVIEDE